MNWHDVLPYAVARRQITFDRGYKSWRMHECGWTYREIGVELGVSGNRAWQLALKYLRDKDRPPPVQRYMEDGRSDLFFIREQLKKMEASDTACWG